eukprot:Skav224757  [mRNA]  locus=scaffold1604:48812:54304:- [translate_table: standard]
MQCVEAKIDITKVYHQHVAGHSGDPLNELADTLAWNTANGRIRPVDPPFDFRGLLQGDALRNLWLCLELQCGPAHWPRVADGHFLLPPRGQLQPLPADVDWTFGYGAQTPASDVHKPLQWNLSIATHNVQSFSGNARHPDDPSGYTGKLALYRAQLHREHILLAGLQETRFSCQQVWHMDGFCFVCTAADHGHGGVALAIKLNEPICRIADKPIFFDASSITVLHADPRLLILRLLSTDRGRYIVVVGHAPHQGHPADHRSAWWKTLIAKLRLYQGRDPCIAFLDANADLGSTADEERVGGHGATDPEANGEGLLDFLQSTDTWLPSTFQRCHHGPHETWIGNASQTNTGKRLDYIALPTAWTYLDICTWVETALDTGHDNIDHFALRAQIRGLQLSERPRYLKADRHCVDWTAVRRCRDDDVWRKIFAKLHSPAWCDDPHLHWQTARAQLLQELAVEFPHAQTGPKRRYVSAQAWSLRKSRNHIKRQLLWRFPVANEMTQEALALYAWAHHSGLFQVALRHVLATLKLVHDRVQVRDQLRTLGGQLRAQLKSDRLSYLESIAEEADQCDPRHIYATLRRSGFGNRKRQQPRPLPFLTDEHNEPYTTHEELQRAWQRHFAQIETGYGVSSLELLQLCEASDLHKAPPAAEAFNGMPSLRQFEEALRRGGPHRAGGTDSIVPELCRHAAKYMARYLYPLLIKSSLYRSEPVQFKGGVLCEVYKGRGPTTDASSYRGILVSSQVAKSFHTLFRQQALPSFTEHAEGLHCGGYPGRPVEFASHGIRLFHAACQKLGRSTGILFVDIRSAYYRLLRQLSIGDTCTEVELCRVLAALRLPDHALLDLYKLLHDRQSVAEQLDMPPQAREQAQSYHQNTWFHTRNSAGLTRTLCGTRPGDGWADLLFNLAMLDILKAVKEQVHHAGLLLQIDWNHSKGPHAGPGEHTTDFLASTWADDLALVVQHSDAGSIVPAMTCLAQIVIDTLSSRGLLLNYGPGKTEALINIRGRHSITHRRNLFHHDNSVLHVPTETQGDVDLRVVQKYRHLGTVLHASGKLGHELRIRLGMARQAFQKHRRAIYQQPKLSLAKRFRIFRSCVLSVAFFGAGTWTPIHPKEWVSFSHGIIGLLKRLIAADVHHESLLRWSDSRVCSFVGCPLPQDLLRIARLTYYRSALTHGPDALWALISLETNWHEQIKDDLQWFWTQTGPMPTRPSPADEPDFWSAIAIHQPGVWHNLLKKTFAKVILRLSIDTEVQVWHSVFAEFLEEAGVPVPTETTDTATAVVAHHACLQCRKLFRSKAAWAVHCFKKHGRRAAHRYYADGSTCDACGRLFLNHVRLGDHLKNNPDCLQELRSRGQVTAPLPGRNSRAWRQADPWTQCPYLQSEGPRRYTQPLADDLMPDDLTLLDDFMLLEDTLDLEEIPVGKDYWTAAIRDKCLATHLDLARIQRHLRAWAHDLADRWFTRRLRPSAVVELYTAIIEVAGLVSVEYFLPEEYNQWLRGCPAPEHLTAEERIKAAATQSADAPPRGYMPNPRHMPRFRQLVFAHLYSGHRREGDLQSQLEKIDWSPDLPPLILSLDVVIDADRCNIFDPKIRAQWYDFSLRGGLHGLMAGPPCESWSVARERFLTTSQGPRPLRRRWLPWAIAEYTIKEGRQLYTANLLLFFSVLLILCQWRARAWGCLEHPALPYKDDAPSIWTTSIFQLLARLGGNQVFTLFQGYFGAVSPKPTSFLTIWDFGHLESLEHVHRSKQFLPAPLPMGKQKGSSFYNTAQLKAYPAALCGLLAAAFKKHIDLVHHADDDDAMFDSFPPALLSDLSGLVAPIVAGAQIGPDLHLIS